MRGESWARGARGSERGGRRTSWGFAEGGWGLGLQCGGTFLTCASREEEGDTTILEC